MSGSKVRAGRDNQGAFAIGDHAIATATITTTITPDTSINIDATLSALKDLLGQIPAIDRKVLTRIDEAKEEASAPSPKRDEVKQLVEQAMKYTRDVGEFAELTGKLTPLLRQVAAWAGSAWQTWAPTLGLG